MPTARWPITRAFDSAASNMVAAFLPNRRWPSVSLLSYCSCSLVSSSCCCANTSVICVILASISRRRKSIDTTSMSRFNCPLWTRWWRVAGGG